ncbi:MAG TPA: helix-turn-helix domain-containing protein [Candidatus Acidoferrum sp.]|nr:helix-turn-helix domain-containing protein [Candidatus Acidoferrum sp.]
MNEARILFEAPKLALTRVEAADALNISPATLDRLVKRGLLRPSRALRRPLFAIAEIERFLRETTGEVSCA